MNEIDKISFRPPTDEDREFLLRVYASSRETELSMVPWDDATKYAFVEHQFDAQTSHYLKEYPAARHDVIVLSESGEPAGRLYVNRSSEQISIMDIAILPEFRGGGIGSSIVADLVDEARRSKSAVQVYIETFNPSRGFFIKRGFTVVSDDGMNVRLIWRCNE
jgi:N-acetylglutamate synthase-like GNAT family acetyltransferase